MTPRFPAWFPVLISAVALLVVVGFVGFGVMSSRDAAKATATAQASGTQTLAAAASATGTSMAGLINCGEISATPGSSQAGSAIDSASCFQFAFESCRPAEIALRSADSGTKQTFTTGKQGTRCYVLMTTEFSDTSKGPTPAPVQCTGEFLKNDGLHISGCGGKDEIVIPAAQP